MINKEHTVNLIVCVCLCVCACAHVCVCLKDRPVTPCLDNQMEHLFENVFWDLKNMHVHLYVRVRVCVCACVCVYTKIDFFLH